MPPKIILYVEDDALLRLTVAELLEERGWRVEVCADGLAALTRIEGGEHFDLLLLDNGLPGVGGVELARRARLLAHRRGTPVVVYSASECGAEARAAGAVAFLRKPQDMGRLCEVVASFVGGR
ncbi:MAG: response regulator [Acidobacteria bacterium]|nr:response regulator [Acidobacteriota bacterium]